MFLLFKRRTHPWATLTIGLLALVAASGANAADAHHVAHAGPHFTLIEALTRAERQHPQFESYRAQLQAAQGRIAQAGIRPAPELGLEIEDAFGSGELTGYSGAQTTLSFSQLIERGGLRDRRIDSAIAGRSLLGTEAEIARLDLRAEVARRFVHVLSDQAQLGITREATTLAQDTLAEVERRVHAARSPLAELSRARVVLERARLQEEHAKHKLLSSRRHLAAATGAQEANFGEAEGDLMQLPPVAEFDALLAILETTPDFLRFADETRLRDSELRLAQARRTPGYTLAGGVRRLEISDDVGFLFSASIPLFAGTRERGHIAEAEARKEQVAAERSLRFLEAQAQLYEIWQELKHAHAEFDMQRERVVPQMEEALKQTQVAYDRGRYSLLDLRDAQTEWAAQRRRLIEVAAEYHGYLIEVQRLTGAPAPGIAVTELGQP